MSSDFFPPLMPTEGDDPSRAASAGHNYQQAIRYWCDSAFEEAKKAAGDTREIQDIENTMDYLAGNQWKGQQPSYKAKPVTNRMLRLFWETVGLLTDIRPIFEVHAMSKEDSYSKTQDILNKLVKAWALETNFDLQMAFVIMYGMITTGYVKLEWDSKAAQGMGDIVMVPIASSNVYELGSTGDEMDDNECVIWHKIVTLDWLRRRFPITGNQVQADITYSKYDMSGSTPSHVSPQLFMSLSPGMKRKLGGDPQIAHSVYPKAEYREFWLKDDSINTTSKEVLMGQKDTNWCYTVKPGNPLYPRGRVICMANRVILADQPNPYWHGKFPFAKLRLNAVPWQQYGMNIMKPWMNMQDILNQVQAGVLNMIKLAVSPPLMAPKNAFGAEAWKSLDMARPNEKAMYNPITANKPEFRPAPQLPAYVLQFNSIVSQEMDMSSGAAAVADAARRKQVPSGDSLDQIQQARNTPIRLMGRNIEGFIGDLGMLFIPNMLQFYTAERRVDLLGAYGLTPADYDAAPGTLVPAGMEPESYARKFKFRIERGSLLSTQHTEKVQYAIKLFAMRGMSLRQLYRILDINVDFDRMLQEMIEEAKIAQTVSPPKPHGGKK